LPSDRGTRGRDLSSREGTREPVAGRVVESTTVAASGEIPSSESVRSRSRREDDHGLRIGVVIPARNALPYLKLSLPAIAAARDRAGGLITVQKVVVVDHHSTDGSESFVRDVFGRLATVVSSTGKTVAEVRNFGASLLSADVLVFLDADCVVHPDYFLRICDVLRDPEIGATGATCAVPSPAHWIEQTWDRMHRRSHNGAASYINSGNFVCRKGAFEAVRGFNIRLVTDEDTDICQRLQAAGFKIYEHAGITAVHLGNPKSLFAFFKRELWHAESMFRDIRSAVRDRPLVMSVAHLGLLLVAAASPLVTRGFTMRMMGSSLAVAVPFAAVIYRSLQHRRLPPLARGTLLYFLYFTARVLSIFRLIPRWILRVAPEAK